MPEMQNTRYTKRQESETLRKMSGTENAFSCKIAVSMQTFSGWLFKRRPSVYSLTNSLTYINHLVNSSIRSLLFLSVKIVIKYFISSTLYSKSNSRRDKYCWLHYITNFNRYHCNLQPSEYYGFRRATLASTIFVVAS